MSSDDIYRAPSIRTDSVQSIQESLAEFSQWITRFNEHQFNETRKWAGEGLEAYRASKSAAQLALQSHDPLVRYGGLYVLANHWEKSADISRICEGLVINDPDIRVKHLALIYIADYYHASDNPRVATLLASIVASKMEGDEIRAAAYRGLLLVRTRDCRKLKHILEHRFPNDVDWELVRHLAGKGDRPEKGTA